MSNEKKKVWPYSRGVEKPIIIVCGGQWGSEGKGMVAAALCERNKVEYAVRTGAVNAGHTVYNNGKQYKMQQLPTGWVRPETKLVLGPGAYVNPHILHDEMLMVGGATGSPTCNRLYIDPRAGIHEPQHTYRSQMSDRHHKIGATGKGCSEAIIDRIRGRGDGNVHLWGGGNWAMNLYPNDSSWYGWKLTDTEEMLNKAYDNGSRILLEGTQGQALDLLLGPWPYTTHKPTSPSQWLVENGLSPALKTEIVMVARTYPIRVAGNSGPMPFETTWLNFAVALNTRLAEAGEGPRVDPKALSAWYNKGVEVAEEWVCANPPLLPKWTDTGRPNTRFENWGEAMRKQYAWGISEFHAEVLKRIGMDHMAELMKLFEFTTVTKKLRRIAEWSQPMMRDAVRQIRPTYAVLTFLNYEFPELWGKEEISDRALRFVRQREEQMGVWIRYVTTGPESKHMIELEP